MSSLAGEIGCGLQKDAVKAVGGVCLRRTTAGKVKNALDVCALAAVRDGLFSSAEAVLVNNQTL